MTVPRWFGAGLGLACAMPTLLYGDSAERFTSRTVQVENDVFAGTDRNYTNGLAFFWETEPSIREKQSLPFWSRPLASRLTLCASPASEDCYQVAERRGWGQLMFSPRDIRQEQLLEDDRPYAGWLHGNSSVYFASERLTHAIELDVGVVGDASLAEEAQTAVHDVIESPRPRGWRHQVANEPTLQVSYESMTSWPRRSRDDDSPRYASIEPYAGATVGNVLVSAQVGFVARLGWNLTDSYARPLRIELGEVRVVEGGWRRLEAYVFVGAREVALAHSIFLDNSLFRDGHKVEKKPFVSSYELGAFLRWKSVGLSYRLLTRGPEFEEQAVEHTYGVVTITFSPWCACG